jgi:hypothetical protein
MPGYVAATGEFLDTSGAERREFDRMDYRTVGVTYSAPRGAGLPPTVERVWTRDVSMTGAKISANADIPSRKIYLKLVLPQFKETIIECEIVRRQQVVRQAINGHERQEFVFGVKFVHLHNNKALPQHVVEALEKGLTTPAPKP